MVSDVEMEFIYSQWPMRSQRTELSQSALSNPFSVMVTCKKGGISGGICDLTPKPTSAPSCFRTNSRDASCLVPGLPVRPLTFLAAIRHGLASAAGLQC